MGGACSTYESDEKYNILVDKHERKRQFTGLGIDVRIILEWELEKYVGRVCNGFIWLRIGTSGGLLRIVRVRLD
jgi:hypothetical protein